MTVVGQAASGAEALEMSRELKPDVVLLDLLMPGRDSLEIVEDLKSSSPRVKVLMLTALPEEHYALRCLRAGADGFLSKARAGETLVEAIRSLAAGRKYISESVATLLAINVGQNHAGPRHELLSAREFQVLRLLASGTSVSDIAKELCLSVKTISTYRARILEKLELENNAQLIRYALKHNIAG